MISHFGGQPKRRGGKIAYPMARLSALLDVGTGLIWQSSLQPYALGEQVAAAEHLSALPTNALTLYDRGYPSFFLMALHRQHGQNFCMRMTRKFSLQIDALFASQSAGRIITLTANPDSVKLCREHGVDASPIRLRLARVELPTEVEILATSLTDEVRYPEQDFGALYHWRWRIEECFKHLKSRLQLENWSGKSALSVKQDVYARVLSSNLVRVITYLAQQRLDQQHAEQIAARNTRRKRQINQTHALHCLRHVLLAYLLDPEPETLERLVQKVLKKTHAVRKHRQFARKKTLGKSNRYPMAYKQTA